MAGTKKPSAFMDRLEDLDEYLMAKVPKPVQNLLFNPKAPKQMKIYDPVLGTLEKVIFVLIAVGVVMQTLRDPENYSYIEVPEGTGKSSCSPLPDAHLTRGWY